MTSKANRRKINAVCTRFGDIECYTLPMKINDVINIIYVAVRGKDEEEGAVQRVLNKTRVNSIKDFVLSGNMFFSTFILNWTDEKHLPTFDGIKMDIPILPSSAQVIDGQHRLAGLEEAIKINSPIGEKEILVTFTIGLTTKEAALIFLNINSEQKPVPKSLIYDLFGEVQDEEDHAINRAGDIAAELHDNPESPFYGAIKYPGKPRGVGIIDLASIISSFKPHLEVGGTFANYNLNNLQNQKTVILNYFVALKYFYDKKNMWPNKLVNPFLTSAGFYGAVEALTDTFLQKCADKKSFAISTFKRLLSLDENNLLTRNDIKEIEGRTRRKFIKEYLETHILKQLPDEDDYEF
jgi:DGQHR domain-containing protein